MPDPPGSQAAWLKRLGPQWQGRLVAVAAAAWAAQQPAECLGAVALALLARKDGAALAAPLPGLQQLREDVQDAVDAGHGDGEAVVGSILAGLDALVAGCRQTASNQDGENGAGPNGKEPGRWKATSGPRA